MANYEHQDSDLICDLYASHGRVIFSETALYWDACRVFCCFVFIRLLNLSFIILAITCPHCWTVVGCPAGDDSNTRLSAGSPCATINGAIGKATAGDTIKVVIGTCPGSTGSEVMLIDKDVTIGLQYRAQNDIILIHLVFNALPYTIR